MVKRFRKTKKYYSKRKLSAKNVYGNRSARAQASQIYSLKKRLNYVWKQTKPEIKCVFSTAKTDNFTSSALSQIWAYTTLAYPTLGTGEDKRIGNFVRLKNVQLNISAEYYNNTTTGYYTGESSGAQCRVIVVQRKTAQNVAETSTLADVLDNAATSGPGYTLLAINSLAQDITRHFHVLADKKFILTNDKNQKMLRVNVKPRNYQFDDDNYFNYCRAYLIVSGLHFSDTFQEVVRITSQSKCVFSDV